MFFEKSNLVRWKFQVEVSNGLLDHSTVSNLHADDHWQFESWDVAGGDIPCHIIASRIKGPSPRGSEPRNRAGRFDKFLSRTVGHWSRCIHTHRKCAHHCCHKDGQPSGCGVWCMCVDSCSFCWWGLYILLSTKLRDWRWKLLLWSQVFTWHFIQVEFRVWSCTNCSGKIICVHVLPMHVAGKIGGFLASIPQVIAAGLLVFMWTMLAALGLSNLRYSETGSSRNVLIVGFSLFLSLSVPAYFQQYKGGSSAGVAGVPSYFQQYTISANGPIHTKYQTVFFPPWTLWCNGFTPLNSVQWNLGHHYGGRKCCYYALWTSQKLMSEEWIEIGEMGAKKHRVIWFVQLNFALNTILSLNMVIAFLVAYILDNTVPGSQLERGTYVWGQRRSARNEPVIVKEYGLPFGLSNYVTWARWVGLWFKTDDQAYETECRYATVLGFLLLEKSIVW